MSDIEHLERTIEELSDQLAESRNDRNRLRSAVKAWLDLKAEMKAMGTPPHTDYWHQSIGEVEAALRAALDDKAIDYSVKSGYAFAASTEAKITKFGEIKESESGALAFSGFHVEGDSGPSWQKSTILLIIKRLQGLLGAPQYTDKYGQAPEFYALHSKKGSS